MIIVGPSYKNEGIIWSKWSNMFYSSIDTYFMKDFLYKPASPQVAMLGCLAHGQDLLCKCAASLQLICQFKLATLHCTLLTHTLVQNKD